jgi:hypothetical protein
MKSSNVLCKQEQMLSTADSKSKETSMKRQLQQINIVSRKLDSRHLQVLLALFTLGLLVLGAGAPAAVGSFSG